MATLKRLLGFFSGGAVVGAVLSSLLMPRYLAWDNSLSEGRDMCQYADFARKTASRLLTGQAVGATVGAIIFVALGIAFFRPKKPAPATTNPPAA